MSRIALTPNASGTGTLTIAAPNTNTDRTLTLPDATGTVNVSGLANEVPAGSAGAPAIYPTGDTNTGMFFPAADTIAFAEGGVERLRIADAGQIGIGGANYGTAGQVLTSGGSGAAPSWASPFAVGQTWQNVTGSRANNTSYQNTTGLPIHVSISATGSAGIVTMFQVSSDNITWVTVVSRSDAALNNSSIVVPNSWYYRLQNCTTITTWAELR